MVKYDILGDGFNNEAENVDVYTAYVYFNIEAIMGIAQEKYGSSERLGVFLMEVMNRVLKQ